MRKILSMLILLFISTVCLAQETEPEIVVQGNAVIEHIYQGIDKIKDSYPKLFSFDKDALKEGRYDSRLRLDNSRNISEEKALSIKYGEPFKQDSYASDNAVYIEIYYTSHPFSSESKEVKNMKQCHPEEIYLKGPNIYLEYYILTDAALRDKLINIIKDVAK